MAYESKLSVPLSDFMAHARQTALHVRKHAARMSAASEKRITAKTAIKLQQLVEQLEQIDNQRERRGVGSTEEPLRVVTDHIAAIAAAALFASRTYPIIGQQLHRVRISAAKRRSAVHRTEVLYWHLGLLEKNKKVLAPLLPKTIVSDSKRALKELDERQDAIRLRKNRSEEASHRRATIIREIRTIVGDVRALAAVLFRYEPELAELFQMPKRRSARISRKPVTAAEDAGGRSGS